MPTSIRARQGKKLAVRDPQRLLRGQINKIISTKQARKACNITDEEMVLLALAASADSWLSLEDIGEFIMVRFRCFQVQAAKYIFGKTAGRAFNLVWELPGRIDTYLKNFEAPIYRQTDEKGTKVYRMSAGAAHHYVNSHILTPATETPLPFLRLPLEVRLMVYCFVLQIKGYRLMVGKKLYAYEETTPARYAVSRELGLDMPSLSEILNPFTVNKQVYQEAMPEFYSKNHFHFPSLRALKTFLNADRSDRRKFMSHVTVDYDSIYVAAAGAKLLAQSDMLQRLTLIVGVTKDETGLLTIATSRRKFASVGQIPGLTTLKSIRGLRELNFDPTLDSSLVDEFLRASVTQPRVIDKAKVRKPKKTVQGLSTKKRTLGSGGDKAGHGKDIRGSRQVKNV